MQQITTTYRSLITYDKNIRGSNVLVKILITGYINEKTEKQLLMILQLMNTGKKILYSMTEKKNHLDNKC